MFITTFPFKYYAILPDSTLTTRIREETWNLDKLFPLLKETKSELKRLRTSISSNPTDILKLKTSIALLAAEIKTGMKDLKLINFYDSAILYLYFRLLKHVLELCKKEEARLMEEKQKTGDIKKAKEELEKNIKVHEKIINGLKIGEKELVKASVKLLNKLRKLRWKAEKQAQHEFSFSKFTLRSLENLNRKVKVEAIKVKKEIIPQKTLLMKRIQQGNPQSKDVIELAKLISKAIERISKDVHYSSKLISKFGKEMKELKVIVENLKKTVNKLVKNKKIREETAKNITKPLDDALRYTEKEIDKDLMQIFRNIFVEYKYVGTRKLAV